MRRYIALGTTVAAIALFGVVAERAAFWNLTLMVMVVLVTWTVAIRTSALRRVFLLLSTVALVLTAAEAVIREIHRPPGPPPDFPAQRYLADVGYCPAPGHSTRSRKEADGRTVFDVRYTIDKNGLRVTPPAGPEPAATLLCFGCSFTFHPPRSLRSRRDHVAERERCPPRRAVVRCRLCLCPAPRSPAARKGRDRGGRSGG